MRTILSSQRASAKVEWWKSGKVRHNSTTPPLPTPPMGTLRRFHCGRGQSPSVLRLNLASESTLPHWCTLFLPTVYALAPVGARISFAAKLTRFAAKSYHIWRKIYGIMAANLYRTREPTRRARATKPQKRRKPADYAGNPLTFRPRREIWYRLAGQCAHSIQHRFYLSPTLHS